MIVGKDHGNRGSQSSRKNEEKIQHGGFSRTEVIPNEGIHLKVRRKPGRKYNHTQTYTDSHKGFIKYKKKK